MPLDRYEVLGIRMGLGKAHARFKVDRVEGDVGSSCTTHLFKFVPRERRHKPPGSEARALRIDERMSSGSGVFGVLFRTFKGAA